MSSFPPGSLSNIQWALDPPPQKIEKPRWPCNNRMIGYFCKKESIINEVQGLCHKEYYYPFMIYGVSRSDIDFDQRKAKQLRHQYE
jgi:hypothetical protein